MQFFDVYKFDLPKGRILGNWEAYTVRFIYTNTENECALI